ncbi:unnamed protein product, partial [Symbiodinium natans]
GGTLRSLSGTELTMPFKIENIPDSLKEDTQEHLSRSMNFFNKVNKEFQKLQEQLQRVTEQRDALRAENESLKMSLRTQADQQQVVKPVMLSPASNMLPGSGPVAKPSTASEGGDRFVIDRHHSNLHKAPVHSVAMSEDSTRVVTASWDATVHVFDLTRQVLDKTLRKQNSEPMGGLYSVAFAKTAPDILGCTSVDRHVYLWNYQTGTQQFKLGGEKGHQDEVNGIDFHEGQQVMATASDDSTAIIWDFAEGIPLRTLVHPGKPVYGVTFLGKDPERQYFVSTCCFDQKTRVFDMRDKKVVVTLSGHTDDIIGIDYSSHGILATGSDDGTILVYDIKTWKVLHKLDCKVDMSQDTEVKRVGFSRDGDMLAAACSTGSVVVYSGFTSADKPRMLQKLSGHTDCVFDVAWGVTPSGSRLLVSASHDKSVRYWKET